MERFRDIGQHIVLFSHDGKYRSAQAASSGSSRMPQSTAERTVRRRTSEIFLSSLPHPDARLQRGFSATPLYDFISRRISRRVNSLELAFDSRSLRDICESAAEARSKLGQSVAEILRHRLADLHAARTIRDLVAGQPRIGRDSQHLVIDLCDGYRLVLTANHNKCPTTPTNQIDWTKVHRIKILGIRTDHV